MLQGQAALGEGAPDGGLLMGQNAREDEPAARRGLTLEHRERLEGWMALTWRKPPQ
jgi:hypothetical protein